MKVGDVTKHVISKSVRRRNRRNTQQVVYKTYMGKSNGKPWYSSQTRHESV